MKFKLIFIAVYLAIIVAISLKWIFVAAPLDVHAESDVPVLGQGSNVNGIEWDSRFSQLYFSVGNPTTTDYDDFEAQVSTDLVISSLKELNGLSDCTIASTHPPMQAHFQRYVDGKPVGPVDDPEFENKSKDGSSRYEW